MSAGVTAAILRFPQEVLVPWAQRPKGSNIALCRFMGAIKVGQERLRDWTMREFETQYLAIQTGSITADKYKKMMDVKRTAAEPGTTMKNGDEELRKLRKLADNTLMLATVFYSDEDNYYRQAVIGEVAKSAQDYQGSANRKCRDVQGSLAHMQQNCLGGLLESCLSAIAALARPASLANMGFSLKLGTGEGLGMTPDHPRIVQEREHTQMAGSLTIKLLQHRLAKFWPTMRGWPERFCLLAHEDLAIATAALLQFKVDFETWEAVFSCFKSVFENRSICLAVRGGWEIGCWSEVGDGWGGGVCCAIFSHNNCLC